MVSEEHERAGKKNHPVHVRHRPDGEPQHDGQGELDDREVGEEKDPCPKPPFQGEPSMSPLDARRCVVRKRDRAQERKDADDEGLAPVHPDDRGERPMLEDRSRYGDHVGEEQCPR